MYVGKDGEWLFSDTNEPVAATWKCRPCGHCNVENTQEGHDGCIGRLPGVMNACCGHGEPKLAYLQFTAGLILRGVLAYWIGLMWKSLTTKKERQRPLPRETAPLDRERTPTSGVRSQVK